MQGGNFTAATVAMAAIAPHFGLDALWKKKSSYGHSGLCAPGLVSVVFSLELQPPGCTVVAHSNFIEFAVRAGGVSSSR